MAMNEEWTSEERAARIGTKFVKERVVQQFLDPANPQEGIFSLYYFIKDRAYEDPSPQEKTILFATGGPGQIVRAAGVNFVDLEGYRVVYFHLRGTGFSQIPKSVSYDKYLRTRLAIEDIDAIRKDLLGENGKWHAIIGHSYGTVLAQQYAHNYKYKDKVQKLVLSAPISRHNKLVPPETKQFESLGKIYESEDFDFLDTIAVFKKISNKSIRQYLVDEAKDAACKVEGKYGNVQFVVDEYQSEPDKVRELKANLDKLGVDYGLEFFAALRRLRQTGWLPFDEDLAAGADVNVDTQQLFCGLLIMKPILTKNGIDLLDELKKQASKLKRIIERLGQAENSFKRSLTEDADRAYYVMSTYDGLNPGFLTAVKGASGKMGGKPIVNPSLAKVIAGEELATAGKATAEQVPAWDPQNFQHDRPTLILKGGADPVTEGGQAEHVFNHALTGYRMLIEFPGIGHSMALPALNDKKERTFEILIKDGNGKAKKEDVVLDTREALIRTFLEKDFNVFKNSSILKKLDIAFADPFKKSRQPVEYVNIQTKP